MKLSDKEWRKLLTNLRNGEIPDEKIGTTIVHLVKPFEKHRVQAAKSTILPFLNHPNSWARHEAMWFLRWGNLVDHKGALIEALQNDPDVDNRSAAALFLAQLLPASRDIEAINALKARVSDENEEDHVRLNSYGALIEIASNSSGGDFFSRTANIQNFDLDWVRSLV